MHRLNKINIEAFTLGLIAESATALRQGICRRRRNRSPVVALRHVRGGRISEVYQCPGGFFACSDPLALPAVVAH